MKIFDIEFEEDSDYPIRKKGYKYNKYCFIYWL